MESVWLLQEELKCSILKEPNVFLERSSRESRHQDSENSWKDTYRQCNADGVEELVTAERG